MAWLGFGRLSFHVRQLSHHIRAVVPASVNRALGGDPGKAGPSHDRLGTLPGSGMDVSLQRRNDVRDRLCAGAIRLCSNLVLSVGHTTHQRAATATDNTRLEQSRIE